MDRDYIKWNNENLDRREHAAPLVKDWLDKENPYCWLLYNAVIEYQPKIIMELGVADAFSTVALLSGAGQVNARVFSIDNRWFFPGIERVQSLSFVDNSRWCFIMSDDLEYVKYWNTPIDLLFIDTEHTYEQTLKELELYAPYVKQAGGIIFLHDTLLLIWHDDTMGVQRAINDFIQKHSEWKFDELLANDIGNCGLGKLELKVDLQGDILNED